MPSPLSPLPVTARQPAFHLLLIVAIGLFAYSDSFIVPFVFDDRWTIVTNPQIRDLSRFFTDPAIFAAFPRRFLGFLTLALNYRLGGLEVAGYHAVNLALHLATALLLYRFCGLLLDLRSAGASCATRLAMLLPPLLFVAHPVQTQAVTYVTQRFSVLATLLYLLSCTLYLSFRRRREAGIPLRRLGPWYGGALLAGLCAMFAKEIAFTLPLAICLLECALFRGTLRQRLCRLGPFLALLSVIPLLTLLSGGHEQELAVLGGASAASSLPTRDAYLTTQPAVLVTYLRLLLLPVNQTLDYDFPLYRSLLAPKVLAGIGLAAALLAAAAMLFRRSMKEPSEDGTPFARQAAIGICWFFLTLAVETIVPLADVINEHRLYLPSIGMALVAGAAAGALAERFSPRPVIAAAVVIVLLLAIATWQRNLTWGDELLLWSDAAAKAPGKARPHYNLGVVLSRRGLLDAAESEFRAALAIDPRHARARYNLGVIRASRGEYAAAQSDYEAALALDPALAEAHNALGSLRAATGNLAQAIASYREAIRLDPSLADARNNLGAALAADGKANAAIVEIESAVRLNPENADYRRNLARAYDLLGLREKAALERARADALKDQSGKRARY
ncbi:MAG: tetratricopeptide repeat protein [Geobacter sp.]|nr:tetratricopeptide repeat protein [Geobacter sp.]